jgi:hypothetical protein
VIGLLVDKDDLINYQLLIIYQLLIRTFTYQPTIRPSYYQPTVDTDRDNPLSRIMCPPITPPDTVCYTMKIWLLFCFSGKKIVSLVQNEEEEWKNEYGRGWQRQKGQDCLGWYGKRDKPQYFVDKVKDKRRTKNNNLQFHSLDKNFRFVLGGLSRCFNCIRSIVKLDTQHTWPYLTNYQPCW